MQENKEKTQNNISFENIPIEEKNRVVNIFAWLINEDKKQNPNLYKK
jgi:hypothetical protein